MGDLPIADPPAAIALDLGSTRFKLGALDADGNLDVVFTAPAPQLNGSGLIREGRPEEFLRTATELVDRAAARWPGHSLGLVSQRSTFTVWHPQSGQPLAPMISWQDRAAANWCDAHVDLSESIARQSGLLLSPHYLGPKLAALQQSHPEVRHALQEDGARVGTLDAWLMWHWNQTNRHQTDLTMAARTALVDIEQGNWSPRLCQLFDVPLAALPQIRPSNSQSLTLDNGLRLNASIADQASGAIAELDPHEDVALVNFGTGAFVLSPQASARTRKAGYLTAPILSSKGQPTRFVLEGTINGAGPALDKYQSGPTVLPTEDDCPEGFAIPDLTGVGSPHWREDIGLTLSAAARSTSPVVKRRIVLEGLLFRVLEILLDLGDGKLPGRTLIAGGAVHDPAIGLGLAQLLQTPVGQLVEPEATLLGVARLAAGHNPFSKPAIQEIKVSSAGAYLPEKYWRWHSWVQKIFS